MARAMGIGGMMNGGLSGMPTAIKQDYLTDPRAAMAMQLMKEGSSTAPVQSPLEGIARALTAGLGGYQAGKVRDEYQGKAAEYANALKDAYSGAGSYSDVASKLSASNNPYLQEQAAALFGKDMESRQKRSDEMFGKGLNYDPNTGQVAPIAGYGGALGGIESEKITATTPAEVAKEQALMPIKMAVAQAGAAQVPVPVFDPRSKQLTYATKDQLMSGNYLPPGAAPNETEKVAGGYALRMAEQEKKLGELAGKGVTGADPMQNLKESIPGVGNFLVSPEQQEVRQAQRDWVRAKLRKESGAVIGPQEMQDEIKTYFPMPGDSPTVIEQKAKARETAAQAMQQAAGNAYQPAPNANVTKNIGGKSYVQINGEWYEQ